MRFLKNMKISTKIIIIPLLAVFFSMIGFFLNNYNINKIKESSSSIYKVRLSSIDYLIEADRDAYQSSIALSHALNPKINSDSKQLKKKIESSLENMRQVKTRFYKFEKIFIESGHKRYKEFGIFHKNYEEWKNITLQIKNLFEKSEFEEADKKYFSNYNLYFESMRDAMDKLTEKSLELAKQDFFNNQNSINQIILISIIMTIFLIIILVTISIFISRSITIPLKNVVQQSEKISGGDLSESKQKTLESTNELGVLASSFSKMLKSLKSRQDIIQKISEGAGDFTIKVDILSEKDSIGIYLENMLDSLNEILGQVRNSAEQISSASNQVSSASQSLSSGASQQASSLEQITTSLTEINLQAKNNAEISIEARTLAEKSKSISQEGFQQMQELVAGMNDINQASEEIKKIVQVIDDIAFQTNLLALNANVEAARAGKFGKGFAVVAEEVRNLAVKSADSVKETNQMVEESIRKINTGNELVKQTANYLEEIMNGSIKSADIMVEIAAASKEQSLGLNQINKGLNELEDVTQVNSASAEESAAASEELAAQSAQLKEMIQKFKLKKSVNEKQIVSEISPEILQTLRQEIKKEMILESHKKQITPKEKVDKEKLKPEKVINLEDNDFDGF